MHKNAAELWATLSKEVIDADSVGYTNYSFWVGLRPDWQVIDAVIERFESLGFRSSRRPEFIDLNWEHKYGFDR